MAVVVLLAFVAGLIIGIIYQVQKTSPQIEQTKNVVRGISSNVINAVIVYGLVSDVGSGRKLTLSYDGDNLDVVLQNSAKIYLYEGSEKREIQLQDVKVGDKANITAEISKDGEVSGNTMVIFPR